MGNYVEKLYAHSITKRLRDLPIRGLNDNDYEILIYHTGMDQREIKRIIDEFLRNHPNGKMNRKEFCDLYTSLRTETPEIVNGLSESIFKALDATKADDLISLYEFLIVFVLTSPGDLKKKLEYAFILYDTNNDNFLDLLEVKQVLYGMLEFFKISNENADIHDIVKDCLKHLKITEVVKKGKTFTIAYILLFIYCVIILRIINEILFHLISRGLHSGIKH
jgi:Ca2+-binding EF-hand superfamily protein